MVSPSFNKFIVPLVLAAFPFITVTQATASIGPPQITTAVSLLSGAGSSLPRTFTPGISITTTWTSESLTFTQTIPDCCFRTSGIPGKCENEPTCKLRPSTLTVLMPASTLSPPGSATQSHRLGQRRREMNMFFAVGLHALEFGRALGVLVL
ncbi:hypothetical protein EAF04_007952 [Stromatinia cepivora]|nr:hypothetical protein EAF04_007952 [Stromatinia cepivora]